MACLTFQLLLQWSILLILPLLGVTSPLDPLPAAGEPTASVAFNPLDPECYRVLSSSPPLQRDQCDGLIAHFNETERRHELLDFDVTHDIYRWSTTREEQVAANRPCFVTVYATRDAHNDHYTYGDLAYYLSKIMRRCHGGFGRESRGGWVRMTSNLRYWSGFAMRADAYHVPGPTLESPLPPRQKQSIPSATATVPSMSPNGTLTSRDIPSPSCFSRAFSRFPELLPHQCDRLFANLLSAENRHIHVTLDDAHDSYTLNVDSRESARQCTITIKSVIPGARDDFTFLDIARFGEAIYEKCRGGFWGISRGGEIPMRFVGQRQIAGFRLRLSGELPPLSSELSANST